MGLQTNLTKAQHKEVTVYYALTVKGYDRIEQGLPEQKSDNFSVLGALADLEETEPLKPHTTAQILQTIRVGRPKEYTLYLTHRLLYVLQSLTKNDLIEEVQKGDPRFLDF